ncbi:MAG: ATP-binding protein [Gammaproteobacteria bacterium]|nr:ATP-binding protein [Gammaproteobacteria bacterium]
MSTDYEKLGAFYLGRVFDPAKNELSPEPLLYDSRDLTTHAVCVGMTGSGKTGLCLSLLEEAAIDGIPAICIDPKGDLGNLMLTFPQLQGADFAPWVDPGEAARKSLSVDQYAAQAAEQWRKGLAEWDQPPERIARFRAAADVAIYTPGSDSGLPLSILQSLAPPPEELLADSGALSERIGSVVSGLLTLLGRDADPLQSREHILLSNLLDNAWRAGRAVDLATLVASVQKPPLTKLGALDLETFFPAKERMALSLAINGLLASPRFATWTRGEPLDAQRLLYTPEGKPRIAIISIAHLSDAERMFVVTLLLNEIIGWMRRQPGTSSLRALLYMDEIFGYFPPTAVPPSKPPMLTLLKQARAFGLGCVLATQNPVDLDYKGLGNTGTWLIGRLQTERDRDRLLDGLTTALSGGGPDRADLARLLGSLTQRVFLMRNVHDDAPVLLKSRWALSYLRGPLTPAEISRLMAPRKTAANSPPPQVLPRDATPQAAAAATAPITAARPPLPAEVEERFMPVRGAADRITYQPRVLGVAKLHFVDKPLGVDEWVTLGLSAPLADDGHAVLWDEAEPCVSASTTGESVPGADFGELPSAAQRAASFAQWGKDLATHLYQNQKLQLHSCDALKLLSKPGESEGDFRGRIQLAAREQRDAEALKLREKFGPKAAQLNGQLQRARDKAERERGQVSQQKFQTAISVGATLLGALLGRKAVSTGNIGRATTAARSASRIGRESQEAERAEESVGQIEQRLADLNRECEAAVAALDTTLDAQTVALRSVNLAPRKTDIAVGKVMLLWMPWRTGVDGFPICAS